MASLSESQINNMYDAALMHHHRSFHIWYKCHMHVFCNYIISNTLIQHGNMHTPHTDTTMQLTGCFIGNDQVVMRDDQREHECLLCV